MNEAKLWQLRAGLITESQYKAELQENEATAVGAEKSIEEIAPTGDEINSVQKLKMYFRDLGSGKIKIPLMDTTEILQLHTYVADYIQKAGKGSIGTTAKTTKRTFDAGTRSVKL